MNNIPDPLYPHTHNENDEDLPLTSYMNYDYMANIAMNPVQLQKYLKNTAQNINEIQGEKFPQIIKYLQNLATEENKLEKDVDVVCDQNIIQNPNPISKKNSWVEALPDLDLDTLESQHKFYQKLKSAHQEVDSMFSQVTLAYNELMGINKELDTMIESYQQILLNIQTPEHKFQKKQAVDCYNKLKIRKMILDKLSYLEVVDSERPASVIIRHPLKNMSLRVDNVFTNPAITCESPNEVLRNEFEVLVKKSGPSLDVILSEFALS